MSVCPIVVVLYGTLYVRNKVIFQESEPDAMATVKMIQARKQDYVLNEWQRNLRERQQSRFSQRQITTGQNIHQVLPIATGCILLDR